MNYYTKDDLHHEIEIIGYRTLVRGRPRYKWRIYWTRNSALFFVNVWARGRASTYDKALAKAQAKVDKHVVSLKSVMADNERRDRNTTTIGYSGKADQ